MKRNFNTLILAGGTLPADAGDIASVASALGLDVMEALTPEAALARAAESRAPLVLAASSLSDAELGVLSSGLEKLRRRPLLIALQDGSENPERGDGRLEVYEWLSSPLDSKHLAAALGRALEVCRLRHRHTLLKRLIRVTYLLIPISMLTGVLMAMATGGG